MTSKYNRFREQNEHMISQNIGQDYRCQRQVRLSDLLIASDKSLHAQIAINKMLNVPLNRIPNRGE